MIKSIAANQEMTRNAIRDYLVEYNFGVISPQSELERFMKFLVQRMLKRVQDDDCYFIDMLEDMERM